MSRGLRHKYTRTLAGRCIMTVSHLPPGARSTPPRLWQCVAAPRSAAPTPARVRNGGCRRHGLQQCESNRIALPQSPAPLIERILSDPALTTERPCSLSTGLLFGDQLAPIPTSLLPHPSSIQPLRPFRKGGSQGAYNHRHSEGGRHFDVSRPLLCFGNLRPSTLPLREVATIGHLKSFPACRPTARVTREEIEGLNVILVRVGPADTVAGGLCASGRTSKR